MTVTALSPEHQLLHATLVAALSDVPARLSTLRDVAQLAAVDAVGASRLADLAAHHDVVAPVGSGCDSHRAGPADLARRTRCWAAGVEIDADDAATARRVRRRRTVSTSRHSTSHGRSRGATGSATCRRSPLPSREFLRGQGVGRMAWLRGVRNPDGDAGPYEPDVGCGRLTEPLQCGRAGSCALGDQGARAGWGRASAVCCGSRPRPGALPHRVRLRAPLQGPPRRGTRTCRA